RERSYPPDYPCDTEKPVPTRPSGRHSMMRYHLSILMLVVAAGAMGLVLPAAFGWSDAHAQTAPPGHRQPRAGEVPGDSSQKEAPKKPEDIVLERALNNICRGCSPIIPVRDVPRYDL